MFTIKLFQCLVMIFEWFIWCFDVYLTISKVCFRYWYIEVVTDEITKARRQDWCLCHSIFATTRSCLFLWISIFRLIYSVNSFLAIRSYWYDILWGSNRLSNDFSEFRETLRRISGVSVLVDFQSRKNFKLPRLERVWTVL